MINDKLYSGPWDLRPLHLTIYTILDQPPVTPILWFLI